MNDDLEARLRRLTPRGAPPELRGRILESVARELAAPDAARPSRRRIPAWTATAAALLLGVLLNHLANRTVDERLARVFGPRPLPPAALELARDVAEAAGPEAGRLVLDRLATPGRPATEADFRRHAADLGRLSREPTSDSLESDDEKAPGEVPQVGRDRLRPPAGRLLAGERRPHLDHRQKA